MEQFGISVALLTPFRADGKLDGPRLLKHVKTVLADGANGVTLFGTTGEGASIGMSERSGGIECLRNGGISPDKIVLGICATAIPDAAAQVEQGLSFGIQDFLLLPPFYYKGSSDDGLYEWHSQLIATTAPSARFILYHIPQVTGVPLSLALVARLSAAFPDRLLAIKDSSGDWENARALLDQNSLPVLVGDERLLHRAAEIGCAGSITGMANLYPARLSRILKTSEVDVALSAQVDAVVSGAVIPALKVLVASAYGDPDWERVRPPLTPLENSERETLLSATQVAVSDG